MNSTVLQVPSQIHTQLHYGVFLLKIDSEGLILEDAMDRFFTGFKLFLQGMGHGEEKREF